MTLVLTPAARWDGPVTDPTRPPRDRMVYAAAQLVREQGVAATGVRDVVDRAQAPRGSFQHYFPGGKTQLVDEALDLAAGFAADWVTAYRAGTRSPTPAGLFAHLAGYWRHDLESRDFGRGCPIVATVAETGAVDPAVTAAARRGLDRWQQAVVDELRSQGLTAARSRRLAVLMLSTLEGAIVLSRAQRSTRPLTTVVGALGPLLDAG